jgi:hypothetical protein
MAVLYFALYLIALVCFVGAGVALKRGRPAYATALIPIGLAAWVPVSVISSGRALND